MSSVDIASSQPASINTEGGGQVSNTNTNTNTNTNASFDNSQQQMAVLYSKNKYYSLISAMIHAAKEKYPQQKEVLDKIHDSFRHKCQNLGLSVPGVLEAFKYAGSGLQHVLGKEM